MQILPTTSHISPSYHLVLLKKIETSDILNKKAIQTMDTKNNWHPINLLNIDKSGSYILKLINEEGLSRYSMEIFTHQSRLILGYHTSAKCILSACWKKILESFYLVIRYSIPQ